MTSLKDQLVSYAAYHRDPRNKLTHFVGVPLVTFSLFLVLGWFRFVHAPTCRSPGRRSSSWSSSSITFGSTGRSRCCRRR